MDRRAFIFGAACSLAAAPATADKKIIGPPGPLGVPTQAWVSTPVPVKQACPLWCWAASASMIFAMNGHPIKQEKIIAQVLDKLVCTTASPSQMTKLLSASWIDDNGNPFNSHVSSFYDITSGKTNIDNLIIIDELENNRPLLYANKHHAMAVVAIGYLDSPMGPNVQKVGVLDPWPPSPNYHFLAPMEMVAAHLGGEYSYLAAVKVT